MYKLFLAGVCAILFSCDKKPTAEFTLDSTEYSAGDIIGISDKSKHAYGYLWSLKKVNSFGYSSRAENKTSALPVGMLTEDGNYDVILTTYSKKKDKTANSSKPVLIKTIRGQLIIWSPSGQSFSAQADNQPIGMSEDGQLSVNLPVGIRYISLSTGQTKTFNITENCSIEWQVQ